MFVSAAAATGRVVFLSGVVSEYLRRKVYIYRSIFTGLCAPASCPRARVFTRTRTRLYPRVRIKSSRGIYYICPYAFSFFVVTKVYTDRPPDSRDSRRRRTVQIRPIDAHAAGALNDRRQPRNNIIILYYSDIITVIILAAPTVFRHLTADRRKDRRRRDDTIS